MKYKIFIRVDDSDRIIDVNSSAFLSDTTGWVQIDEGTGDRYHHAQNNYLPKLQRDDRGIPRYAYVPDSEPAWRERTPEEMNADYKPQPTPPSDAERITNLENALSALQEGIDSV